jgi:hypothetical protein
MRLGGPPKGGSDEHVSVDRNIGDSGFSLLQRPGRFHGHQVSSLNCVFAAQLWIGVSAFRRDRQLVQGFGREVAEIEEEFFQGGTKQ